MAKRPNETRAADEADRIAKDRAFILKPSFWPCWPFLPMVRRDGDNHRADWAGFLEPAKDQSRPTLYLADFRHLEGKRRADLPKRVFESLDALVAEYRVD